MQIQEYELTNKIPVVQVLDGDCESVTILVIVKIGSRHDPLEKEGLAHFTEHMLFKGTKKRPKSKDIATEIEMIGGQTNAFTSYEYTGYYIKVPYRKISKAIEIIADIIKDSQFIQEDINLERGVINEEIRMYEDVPAAKVSHLFGQNLFSGHPLGNDIAGTVKSVANITREDFVQFIQSNYGANNLALIVSGNLKDNVKEELNTFFGSIPQVTKPIENIYTEGLTKNKQIISINKKLEQTHIVIGGYGFRRDSEYKFQLGVANVLLGVGFGSLLFQKIREQLGLAYYVGSSTSAYNEIGKFEIRMGVDNSKVTEAIKAVVNEISRVISGKFTNKDLLRAKNFSIGSLVTEVETSEDLAEWIGLQKIFNKKVLTIQECIEEISKVTKEDVTNVWALLTKRQNIFLAAYGNTSRIKQEVIKL